MAVVVSLFSFSLQASELKKVSVQLLWKHQFEFAGFYMAKEKGFYKDAGINVDLKEYQFGTNIAQEVSNGKVDFGVDSSSLILDKINGLDVYLLMPFLQTSPFVLMSKQRDDLKTVLDLKNKKIMITPNQVTMASLNAMFKINQLSNKDFISQEHSFNVQDLIDGKTDAMSVYLSNEPYYMIEKGLKYTIFNPSDYGFNFYDNVLFTSKKLATNNPEIVENFNEATQKGWEYAYTHIEETANVILKSYNTQNKTFEHLVYEGNQLKKMSHFGEPEYQKFKPEVINQIIQTYNLLDISKSTIDINELVYPDAIYKESDINFALLIKIFIAVLILLIGFYYWNRKLSKLNKKIQQSQEKVSLLLNNAGQGFLTFKSDFKIDSEYSKECERLLGEEIALRDITELLFDDVIKQEFFKNTLLNALTETMEIKRNSYVSLLPTVILLNKKAIKLEYKILNNETFMMILTNITSQKKLENKIKKEQEIFKMIVTIVSESEVFYDTKKEYLKFINSFANEIKEDVSFQENINQVYRIIHTFKGTFSQLFMQDIVSSLHTLEGEISNLTKIKIDSNDRLKSLLEKHDFKTSFEKTIEVIREILGDEFLDLHNFVKIDVTNIKELQDKIEKVLKKEDLSSPQCRDIIEQIQSFSSVKLYPLLKPYIGLVEQLGKRFEKDIEPLIIDGDKNLVVPHKIKPLIKSFVHIFRNSVDHGIETAEMRIENDKEEFGTIICSFEQKDNYLYITISDDGAGIDKEKLKQKALLSGVLESSINDKNILDLIFNDNLTTKEKVTDLSGRGIGMGAVKQEVERLNGAINVVSQPNEGTTFEFKIPLGE